MSAPKSSDKKIIEDETTDSGYLSGQLSSGPLSEPLSSTSSLGQSDNKNVISEICGPTDSGIVDVSENLSNLSLGEFTQTPQQLPSIKVEKAHQNIPPLKFLFERDEDGDTQLHIAAVHGYEKLVGTLIKICPNKAWLDIPNDYRHTALHLAVMGGHASVARMLVIAGASLGARDLQGQTPIHIATVINNVHCLHGLLMPVTTAEPVPESILNQKNYDGQTCVHLAAAAGNIEVLQTLMHYKADLAVREGHGGWTALHIAARRGDEKVVRLLLQNSRTVVTTRDYAGRRARRLARHTPLEKMFENYPDSDSESDSDDDDDSDSDTMMMEVLSTLRSSNSSSRIMQTV